MSPTVKEEGIENKNSGSLGELREEIRGIRLDHGVGIRIRHFLKKGSHLQGEPPALVILIDVGHHAKTNLGIGVLERTADDL
jgi:hypothetical protein